MKRTALLFFFFIEQLLLKRGLYLLEEEQKHSYYRNIQKQLTKKGSPVSQAVLPLYTSDAMIVKCSSRKYPIRTTTAYWPLVR